MFLDKNKRIKVVTGDRTDKGQASLYLRERGVNEDSRMYYLLTSILKMKKFAYRSYKILKDEERGSISPDAGGFWKHAAFDKTKMENPWRYGSKMAPFDQKFYIIINLAVGGVNGYFPDDASNPTPKPRSNNSPLAMTFFWINRTDWFPTWNLNTNGGNDASLKVDYVKVWAI